MMTGILIYLGCMVLAVSFNYVLHEPNKIIEKNLDNDLK